MLCVGSERLHNFVLFTLNSILIQILLLVVRMLLVAMPGAPSSVLAPRSDALRS